MMFSQLLNNHRILKRLAKALIRLRACAGWSEALLVAHTTLLEILYHGSITLNKHLAIVILSLKTAIENDVFSGCNLPLLANLLGMALYSRTIWCERKLQK